MLENVVAFAFMSPQHIIGILLTSLIGLVLLHASYEDIRRRDIGSIHVIVLFILVSLYTIVTGTMGLQTTYVFLFAFILFIGISALSFGHFGMGDSLVIGALAWYLGTFSSLQTFLYSMGLVAIPWAIYWSVRYRKDNTLKSMLHGFKQIVPIDKVKVGDVLSYDNFMHGLELSDIEKLKVDGFITVEIKKPMPFIPCIFIAFLIVLVA